MNIHALVRRVYKERATYGFSLLVLLTLPLVGCGPYQYEREEGRVVSCRDQSYYQLIDIETDDGAIVSILTDQDDSKAIPGCGLYAHGGRFEFVLRNRRIVFVREEKDLKEKKP